MVARPSLFHSQPSPLLLPAGSRRNSVPIGLRSDNEPAAPARAGGTPPLHPSQLALPPPATPAVGRVDTVAPTTTETNLPAIPTNPPPSPSASKYTFPTTVFLP